MLQRRLAWGLLMALGLGVGQAGCQQHDDKSKGKPTPSAAAGGGATARPGGKTQTSEELASPLAKVGDVTITVAEFQEQLNRQSPYIRARYTSLEQKREFLDSLVRFEILAAEAQRRGLDKDPEVVRTMKSVMVQKLMRDQFDAAVPPDAIADAEMKTYYDANIKEYVKPEEVRASAIVMKSKAQADKVAAEAQGEAGKTNKGFRDLVAKYSTDDKTKGRGGDLRYFPKNPAEDTVEMPPKAVVDAAFALPQTGAVSGAIDAGDGTYWVIKETGHRRAMTRTYEDVEQSIRTKLHRDKRQAAQDDFVQRLRQQATIEVLDDNLEKVRVQATKQPDPQDNTAPPAPSP